MIRNVFRNLAKVLGLAKDRPVPAPKVIETPFQSAYQDLLQRHQDTVQSLTTDTGRRRGRRWRKTRENRIAMQKESRRRNRVA